MVVGSLPPSAWWPRESKWWPTCHRRLVSYGSLPGHINCLIHYKSNLHIGERSCFNVKIFPQSHVFENVVPIGGIWNSSGMGLGSQTINAIGLQATGLKAVTPALPWQEATAIHRCPCFRDSPATMGYTLSNHEQNKLSSSSVLQHFVKAMRRFSKYGCLLDARQWNRWTKKFK